MVVRYQKTIANCQPIADCKVLDVGCGPGHYSVALAKAGASEVVGIDFATNMVRIASARAKNAGVASRCSFVECEFLAYPTSTKFDYVILMGFMDYMKDPESIISHVTQIVRKKAFFSFPAAGGFLAWQRQLRYRRRCDLFLYKLRHIDDLMSRTGCPYLIEMIGRDYFVTLSEESGTA